MPSKRIFKSIWKFLFNSTSNWNSQLKIASQKKNSSDFFSLFLCRAISIKSHYCTTFFGACLALLFIIIRSLNFFILRWGKRNEGKLFSTAIVVNSICIFSFFFFFSLVGKEGDFFYTRQWWQRKFQQFFFFIFFVLTFNAKEKYWGTLLR